MPGKFVPGTSDRPDLEASAPNVHTSLVAAGVKQGAATNKEEVKRIPEYVSRKLQVLILFGTIGVLYIHAYTGDRGGFDFSVDPQPRNWSVAVQAFFSGGILRPAVPLFFTISGLLFFTRRPDDLPAFQFSRRITQRVWSIGIPYVLWNAFAIVFVLVSRWLRGSENCDCCMGIVNQYVLLNAWIIPIMTQLWYLRDLLVLAFLSPVLHGLLRLHAALVAIFFLAGGFVWAHQWSVVEALFGYDIVHMDGVMFFSLGAYLALTGVDLEHRLGKGQFLCLAAAFLSFNAYRATVSMSPTKTKDFADQLNVVHHMFIPLGVATAWFGYDLVEPLVTGKQVWPWISWLGGYSMWLYCAHLPFLCYGTNMAMEAINVLGLGPGYSMALYVASPLLTMAACLAIGVPLARHGGQAFSLLTGGRTAS